MPGTLIDPEKHAAEVVKDFALNNSGPPGSKSDLQNAEGYYLEGQPDPHFILVELEHKLKITEDKTMTEEEKKAALADASALGEPKNIKSLSSEDLARLQASAAKLQGMELSPAEQAQLAEMQDEIKRKQDEEAKETQRVLTGGIAGGALFAKLRGSSGDGSDSSSNTNHGIIAETDYERRIAMGAVQSEGLSDRIGHDGGHGAEENSEHSVQAGSGAPVQTIDGMAPAAPVVAESVVGNEIESESKGDEPTRRDAINAVKMAILQDPSIGHGFINNSALDTAAEKAVDGKLNSETTPADIIDGLKSGADTIDEGRKHAQEEMKPAEEREQKPSNPYAHLLADFKAPANVSLAGSADFNSVSAPKGLPAATITRDAPPMQITQ